MKIPFAKTAVIGIAMALLGSACSNIEDHYKGAITLPKNEVEVSSFSHQINFTGEGGKLSAADKAALDNFLNAQNVQYGDELILDFAAGDGAWAWKMETINNFLKTRGFWVKNAGNTGAVTNPKVAALLVNRYQVVSPDCMALSEEGFVPTEMWTNKTFGCITAHNLGVMVANPKDLIEGRPDAKAETFAAVRAIQLYRGNISRTSSAGSFSSLLSSLF